MRPKTYNILSEAVEIGIRAGYKKAFKHTDTPSEDFIFENVYHYIMLEISEKFDFDNPGEIKPVEDEK